jgi:glycolate oxidase
MTISVADELRRIAKGEILSDSWSRDIYSVDASHYTIRPSMIVCPSDEYDVEKNLSVLFYKEYTYNSKGSRNRS